jgi:hypothetical protein
MGFAMTGLVLAAVFVVLFTVRLSTPLPRYTRTGTRVVTAPRRW